MSLGDDHPQILAPGTYSPFAVWLNNISAYSVCPLGNDDDLVYVEHSERTPKQIEVRDELPGYSPSLGAPQYDEPPHSSHSTDGFEYTMSGITCINGVTGLSPVEKSSDSKMLIEDSRRTNGWKRANIEAATQTSNRSSRLEQTAKPKSNVQRYRQRVYHQESKVLLKEIEHSICLSDIQANLSEPDLDLRRFTQLKMDLDEIVADLAAEREMLAYLRSTLAKQEQFPEDNPNGRDLVAPGEEIDGTRSSRTISESGPTGGSKLSVMSEVDDITYTHPPIRDDLIELDLPPTIVLDDYRRSSTIRTPQSDDLIRLEPTGGSYVSFRSNFLPSPRIDQDYGPSVMDSNSIDQLSNHDCVRYAGYQFSMNDSEVESTIQSDDDIREDNVFVCRKRERDLAQVMDCSPLTGSGQSTNFENFIDSEIASYGLGHKISYWILQLFLCSWLEFSRFILLADSEPDVGESITSIGYIHLTFLIYANWFSDGTLVEYRTVLSFHPSVSSVSDDIPHYFQQIYIGDSDDGHGELEHFQLFNNVRSPEIQQASRIAPADQSDRSGNSGSPNSSKLWSPPSGRDPGTFDTEYEGFDAQRLATRPFVPFGRSRAFGEDNGRDDMDQSQVRCSND